VDITTVVTSAMSGWLAALATALLAPAVSSALALLVRTPDLATAAPVVAGWELVRDISDALFVVAVLASGVLVMVHAGSDARYEVKRLVPRLVLAAVLSNASLRLTAALLALNNAVVAAVVGASPVARPAAVFGSHLSPGAVDLAVLVIALAAALLALVLAALLVARFILLAFLVVLAPLALAAYALPRAAELADLWWRLFLALLFVQVLEAVLVNLAIGLLANPGFIGAGGLPDILGELGFATVLYLLVRLPLAACTWALRLRPRVGPLGAIVALRTRAAGGIW